MNHSSVIDALGALAHEHRLRIYRALVAQGPSGLAAGAIGGRVGLLPSSLTFHLQSLERAGLLAHRRDGRQLIYSADFEAMEALVGYLTENCCAGGGNCDAACKPASSTGTARRSRAA